MRCGSDGGWFGKRSQQLPRVLPRPTTYRAMDAAAACLFCCHRTGYLLPRTYLHCLFALLRLLPSGYRRVPFFASASSSRLVLRCLAHHLRLRVYLPTAITTYLATATYLFSPPPPAPPLHLHCHVYRLTCHTRLLPTITPYLSTIFSPTACRHALSYLRLPYYYRSTTWTPAACCHTSSRALPVACSVATGMPHFRRWRCAYDGAALMAPRAQQAACFATFILCHGTFTCNISYGDC